MVPRKKPDAQEIRKQVLALRKALTPEQVSTLSSMVTANFKQLAHGFVWSGVKVGLYQSLQNELDLSELAIYLVDQGAQIYYPRVLDPKECTLEFVHVQAHAQIRWKSGHFRIKEPADEHPGCNPKDLEILFIPGVALGSHGERLGWGAGFYDRFISRHPHLLKVVLAFDFQVLDSIPQNSWDQPMDWIVTESREFRIKKLEKWFK